MGSKKRIGIYFTAGANWLGGVYYLVNLVNSCSYLPSEEQQRWGFTIFYNEESERFVNLFAYEDVRLVKLQSVNARKAFLKSMLLRKNLFLHKEITESDIIGLYPFNDFPVRTQSDIKLVSWYPDLQHRFYPEYFQRFKLWQRELRLKQLIRYGEHLVMSSLDVKSHFDRFYPQRQIRETVLPFVSLTDPSTLPAADQVTTKYGLDKPYFMVSNQFYKHKDHKTLLEAIERLKATHPDLLVAMTGKMEDYRDPAYIDELKSLIERHTLQAHVRLLGVIPRVEQLSLMLHAVAVIQPSLFEGWSTVVEDVKSIGGRLIVSDIEIHKEQLGSQGLFFRHSNPEDLASKMTVALKDKSSAQTDFYYRDNIVRFAREFVSIFDCYTRE